MPSLDDITEARRVAIADTIHPVTTEDLKTLGEGLFPIHDHPWREKYYQFITENADAAFFHATTDDRIHIIYCQTKNQGLWFSPGSGMGPLQARGLQILKETVEGKS
jgi:hypothetical protein